MITLRSITEDQTRRALGASVQEFEYIKTPSPDHLHDPFYYKDMREIITYLHAFKNKQQANPNLLLVVDGDYDTDGIMSSAILTASLDVFGITHRVYIPSMDEGYGLSITAVDNMMKSYETEGFKIGMILTADNGIRAFEGIDYANSHNITVLVTDHHPGGETHPNALALVDPNRFDDLYPFKGNSGACVAWKTMLAYANTFQKDTVPLIEDLIIFAGIANVADVMPILNENRYIVKSAVDRIVKMLARYESVETVDYSAIMQSPYRVFNTVFYGICDLVMLLQEHKDKIREEAGKSPIPLPMNEELFGWYLSPLLNAPRRVHGTCFEGLLPFIVEDKELRHFGIRTLINLNDKKSVLRDKVLDNIPADNNDVVICVNTRSGISGLIAAKRASMTNKPSIVFNHDAPDDETIVFETAPMTQHLTASARSNSLYPLDMILDKLNERAPGIATGGGHAAAAGFTINASQYELFKQLIAEILPEVHDEVASQMVTSLAPDNLITIIVESPTKLFATYNILDGEELLTAQNELDTLTFAHSLFETMDFQDSLRPFGHGFDGKTSFRLKFNDSVYQMGWNPDFWKTFKFNLFGAEVLTFDVTLADKIKHGLKKGYDVTANVELKTNSFGGQITPQLIIS